MILNIYMQSQILDILKCFGTVETVINNIVDQVMINEIDIATLPPAPDRINCGKYKINIHNEDYCKLVKIYGSTSSRISLRRLIYWFVENEVYNEWNWKPVNKFVDRKIEKIKSQLITLIELSEKLQKSISKQEFDTIIDSLITFKEKYYG